MPYQVEAVQQLQLVLTAWQVSCLLYAPQQQDVLMFS